MGGRGAYPLGVAKMLMIMRAVTALAAMSVVLAATAGTARASSLSASVVTPDCTPTAGGGNLCVLNPTAADALVVMGTSSLTLARDLVVNSSSANAAHASESSTVVAAAIGGPGGFAVSNGGSFSPAPVNSPAQPDPFAGSSVAHDACSGGSSLTVLSGSQSASAGTYASLGAGGSGTLTLNPGVYTITGTFSNLSGGTINGTGITLFFCPGASFSLTGTSSTTLSSPTGSSGFVIFYDPTSTGSFATSAVQTNFVGAIYAKSAALQLQNLSVQGDVVADTVNIHSAGIVTVASGPSPTPTPTSPSITTSLSANTIALGAGVHDSATLLGATAGAGGTVSYTVYPSLASCTAGTGGTAEGTVAVSNASVPDSSTFTPTSAGTYYWQAVYSGDSNNNGASSLCSSEPPEGLAKIFLGYADTYFPRGTGLPSIWNGSPGVIFVGCGVNANEGGPAVPNGCPQEPVGPPRDEYDAGAIRIDNPSATAPLVVGGPASVTIGSCVYSPWPGLKRTIPPGGTLILAQTGLTGDPCGQNLGGNYNLDTSESSGNGNCIPSPAVPAVTFTLNGSPATIDDGAQILNKHGIDPGACTGVNEVSDWIRVHGEMLTVVDAQILISGNATNAVNTAHTFTVTVNQNLGDGHGFVPVAGATVTPALAYSNGATAQAATGTCTTGTTNSSGQCTIIVNSTTAGLVTVNASTNVTVSGQSITRTTGDGLSGDSSNATKTYVDSFVTIGPASANNPLNATHTLTAQVFVDAGGGAGYVAAPNGTTVTFTLLPGSVGSFIAGNTCTTASGACTVTTTSSTAAAPTRSRPPRR